MTTLARHLASVALGLVVSFTTVESAIARDHGPRFRPLPVKIVRAVPITTQDGDAPFLQPYQESGDVFARNLSTITVGVIEFAPVPEDKRLVIQYASVRKVLDPGSGGFCGLQIREAAGAAAVFTHTLPMAVSGNRHNGDSVLQASTPIVAYAEPGQVPAISCSFTLQSGTPGYLLGALSGYFVDR